ncbi:tetratricopeptide repeat protein [Rubrivivax gelatinosus]|uniref:TPR repeat protein n=1 Tax=Rubrivivax gelatinosus (strain NBRC 100245 / IL144) TaxID=983917 RepID=I0HNM7_RUBGI|nr:tetratricopeptide repeat protein [Rubrivivax gelatinosus]BAL94614.1 TPR repeat protein [Rubrivivax gelatinosus IL144]
MRRLPTLPRALRVLLATMFAASALPAAALDLDALWDFGQPALSEQRFRAALADARGDDALVLRTQIARTKGLRRDFDGALAELAAIEPQLATAGPEASVRFLLERGRARISPVHDDAARTPQALAAARADYLAAAELARRSGLDGLAVDALHMMAFVDREPADALRWTQQALDLASASPQPAARRWEASLRNNLGTALHDLGRHAEAIAQFRAALALRLERGQPERIADARFALGWALREAGQLEEALAIQTALDRAATAAGRPDAEVLEELEAIQRARGDAAAAAELAARRQALRP